MVVSGGPSLGGGSVASQARVLARDHDWLRRAMCLEPRGHEAMVGAVLCEPAEPDCACGVIFFNNVSTLRMCVHGTIGVVVTLAHLGRIGPGRHRIDTPAGVVEATLSAGGRVEVTNVPSRVLRAAVAVEVPGWGLVTGDLAWGGNGFFLIDGQGPAVEFANCGALTSFAAAAKAALHAAGHGIIDGVEIDHVELFGPPRDPSLADSRNFVLCPGNAYDRSPCGTGTSAKLASLHARGVLAEGDCWRQAGILDTIFEGRFTVLADGAVLPAVSGRAWILAEARHIFDVGDPFRHGIADPSHPLPPPSSKPKTKP